MKILNKLNFFVLLATSLFFMACSDSSDETTGEIAGEVTLLPSKSLIEADNVDVTSFTVMQGDVDVTQWATIYQKVDGKWIKYDSTTFSTGTEGTYEFSADHNGISSETVMIQAATNLAQLPADTHPNQFNNFRKRVLAMQFTGIQCGYCPIVINAIENFQSMPNAANTVFAALHSYNYRDPMYSDDAWEVARNMGISSYPTMSYNLYNQTDGNNTTAEVISSIVESQLSTPANSGISASVTLEGSETEGKLKVQGGIKIAKDGIYRVAAWVLEDGITATQTNYTELTVGSIHNNSVRLCSTTDPSGSQFGGRNNWKAGEMGVFYHEFDLKNSKIKNLENCHVVIYVTSNSMGSFLTVDNVIDCTIGEVRSFEYEN